VEEEEGEEWVVLTWNRQRGLVSTTEPVYYIIRASEYDQPTSPPRGWGLSFLEVANINSLYSHL
jgi:hypothetical protein